MLNRWPALDGEPGSLEECVLSDVSLAGHPGHRAVYSVCVCVSRDVEWGVSPVSPWVTGMHSVYSVYYS